MSPNIYGFSVYPSSTDRNRALPKGGRARSGSPGKRCYAIGDVHGRLDLLEDLIRQIDLHNAERSIRDTAIVLLGDLVDRGPDSRGVVEFLRTFRSRHSRLYLIAGNHEELMLRSLEGDTTALQTWIANGGDATAQSYGIAIDSLYGLDPHELLAVLANAVPPSHVAFLKSAADSIRFGDYLLTHAGVRPGVPLADQTTADLRWIRKPFLESHVDHGFVVVHGHSTRASVEVHPNRVGIDTGAYRTGVLTAMWIEDERHGFLKSEGSTDPVWSTDLF